MVPEERGRPPCGTWGCTLPDRHSGLHRLPQIARRKRTTHRPLKRLGFFEASESPSSTTTSIFSSTKAARRVSEVVSPDLGASTTAVSSSSERDDVGSAPEWWTRVQGDGRSHRSREPDFTPDIASSVRSLAGGVQRSTINICRTFFDSDEDYLARLLVLAGRTIDLRSELARTRKHSPFASALLDRPCVR
jgi:hypothetical protein